MITIGSSKGGTCAIYYGLLFGASDIYAGACQYYVGKYLNTEEHIGIFKAMMGTETSDKAQKILDSEMPEMIRKHKNSESHIHLLYSVNEHTYNDDIQYLVHDLDCNGIKHSDKIESFNNHGDIGKFFSPWIKHEIEKIINNGQE